MDFAPLDAVVARLKQSAHGYDQAYAAFIAAPNKLNAAQRKQLNALLQGMEQRLTDARGLPGRDWFRHFVYAPGRLTGYGVKTLPAVREAIDAGRWQEAREYVPVTAQVLGVYCDGIDAATALLQGSG
jgi:N-acetylated-alpha-linked acidic dipeptidase